MLTAALICASLAGTVLDALTGRPVSGAVVTDGKQATTITDGEGRFQLSGLTGRVADVMVQQASYRIFAQPSVPLGTRMEIRLHPSPTEAEPIEVVETREEELRPMVKLQEPIRFPTGFELRHAGQELRGLYRVCVGRNGRIALAAALNPANDADPYVTEGIARGWEYQPLSRPACFFWRMKLRFSSERGVSRLAPEEQMPPPGTSFGRK
ncbi:MAG: carboxypeptidase-like regulatory domain-containing protein [Myxococcales bacterium]